MSHRAVLDVSSIGGAPKPLLPPPPLLPPTAAAATAHRSSLQRAAGQMDEPVLLPPNIEEIPPPGLALVEELDKLLLVQVGRWAAGVAQGAGGGPCSPAAALPLLKPVQADRQGQRPRIPCRPPQLRDGRKIIGTLRSFDQFANLVLQGGGASGALHPVCQPCRCH